jgi:hypothetical protein
VRCGHTNADSGTRIGRHALLRTDRPAAEHAADPPTLIEVYRRPTSAAMDHAGIPASWTRGNWPDTMSQSTESQLFTRSPRVDDSIGLLREIEKSFAPSHRLHQQALE